MKKIFTFLLISSFVLSACGSKKVVTQITPTPVPREYVLSESDKPQVNLSPRNDGHELTLKISGIKTLFTRIEYELIYTASDQGLEIEKGVSGNFESKDIVNGSAERKILLGTESCTNGCKYKYDSGVNGGTLGITLNTSDNQVASLEMPFKLTNVKSKGFVITWQ